MSPTEKVLNQRRNINMFLLRQKWSITSIFGADNKVIVADKTTINIQALLNTADIEDKFWVKSHDLCFYPTPRVDFVNKNIDLYCVTEGGEYYVYFEGKLVFTLANLETALNVLIDEDAYIKLFVLDMFNNPQEESCTFQSHSMVKLHDKLSSITWSQYSYNLVDYGVKKVVRIKELLACQDMVTHVCQVLESQTVSRKDIFEFLEQELTIYMTHEQTMRISYPFKDGTLPIVYFVSWYSLLEWLTKIGNYTLLFKNIKSESIQPQKAHSTMSTPSDHTTVSIIFKKTSLQENQKMHEIIKHIEYLQVYDYMSAKEFTSNVLNDEGFTLVSISELLECTKSTNQFLELAKTKADKGDLIDLINIGNTVKYAKLVIRHNHKTKGYSIGKDKVKFKDFNELCHFLSDVEKLVSLFCVDKTPKKETPKKTEKQTKRDTMVAYISGKINHRCDFDVYRSQFKMLDFLTQNSLWPDLHEKLKKLTEETPEMHMFNSVPESIKIEKCLDNDGYYIYVSCSYNEQDEHFSTIKVFRDEIAMLEWLMDPINLVKKFDKDGKLVTQKQTNLCKRTMFDTALNEYLRSNTSIPYKKGIVYHPLNLKDFAMWYCGKKGGHDNQLLDIFNAPTAHLGNYRFFVDNGEARNSNQYLYSLRAMSISTSIDWTTNVTDIFSFLFDNYVKSGHA